MTAWCRTTDYVIIVALMVLVLYNVAAGIMSGGEATISARIQHHATRFPVVPMLIGMLAAHWFWPVFGVRSGD